MANISRNTFKRIKHYVGVRLQQGVPLVDADWNELEDIRKYELQAFLKWFVGDGVPQGNDGFRIAAVGGADNDFTITGGDGTTAGAGYCLVEGWDALIESSLRYTEQPLFGNAALAAAWGVAELPALTTPNANRRDTVYLDAWEREVDAAEDAELINSSIGLETCVRTKREWVVRVEQNADSPPATPAGHVFYPLATLDRPANAAAILPPHIADRRLTGLTISSWKDTRQITRDAFGDGYTLDHDGEPNLKVPLREAINALLRGGVPMTPPAQVSMDSASDYDLTAISDSVGDIWVFWRSYRSGDGDIWYNRYLGAAGAWEGETRLTTASGLDLEPRAAVDGDGDLWVIWRSNRDGNYDIWVKRYSRANGTWGADEKLSTHASNDQRPSIVVDTSNDIWVFWDSHRSGNTDVYSRRFDSSAGAWDPEFRVTTDAGSDLLARAVVGGDGDIWVFWRSYRANNYDIYTRRFDRVAGTWGSVQRLTFDAATDSNPFAVTGSDGDIWLFYDSTRSSDQNIWYRRYRSAQNSWSGEVQLTTATGADFSPRAIAASNGDIWVTWTSYRRGNYDIWCNRYSAASDWAGDQVITTDTRDDYESWIAEDSAGDIWVTWRSFLTGNLEIWYRKLVPEV